MAHGPGVQLGLVNPRVLWLTLLFRQVLLSVMSCVPRLNPTSTARACCQLRHQRQKPSAQECCNFFLPISLSNLSHSSCARKAHVTAISVVVLVETDPTATSLAVISVMATSVVRAAVQIVLVVHSSKPRLSCHSVQNQSEFVPYESMSMQCLLNYQKLSAQSPRKFSLVVYQRCALQLKSKTKLQSQKVAKRFQQMV